MAGVGPRARAAALAFAGALLAGCGPTGGGAELGTGGPAPSAGTGTLVVELTDAAFLAHDQVREARIVLSELALAAEADASEGFTQLLGAEPVEVDLAALRNGRTARVAEVELPAGSYAQLRLTLSGASLRFEGGASFASTSDDLRLGDTAKGGHPLWFAPALEVRAERRTTVLLDFDLTRTFVQDATGTPGGARTYLVQPVVRAVDLARCGTLRGVVRESGAGGGLVPVEEATLYLLPTGMSGIPRSVSGTASDPDGGYAFLGVPPGVYDVWAMKAGRQVTSAGHVVADATTVVDLLLP